MSALPPEVLRYYAAGREHVRITRGPNRLELIRTQDILRRHLPPPPARVLDVGGGAGVHAEWLAGSGYAVHLVDPVPLHVEQAQALGSVTAAIGDARQLAEPDASYDATLLLGPLYHLVDRAERVRALAEAGRVTRPGGLVAAAAISRFAPFIDGFSNGAVADPRFAAMMERDLLEGQHRNEANEPGWFTTAYFHHPDELPTEIVDAGLDLVAVVAVEGPVAEVSALDAALDDPPQRALLLRTLRRLEGEPSLLGASPHLLALARHR